MTTTRNRPPRDFEGLKELLLARRDALPRRLVQVAAFALENPDEIAFGTVASVAAQAHVQPSTLIRFAQTIGYAGFSDLQEVFRAQLKARWPEYRERIARIGSDGKRRGGAADLLDGFAESAVASIDRLRNAIGAADLDRAAAILASADTIYLLGLRRAFPVTAYLAYALGKLGLRAALVDQVAALGPEQLGGANRSDALVAVSFTPYSPVTVDLTRQAAERDVPVIAITDSPFSPLSPSARVQLEIVEADYAGFRSLSATLCLAMALAVATGALRESGSREAGMAREYYFLSDLHLGGDAELMHCDFIDEFVAFLNGLAARGGDAELIIGGDLFGFWELTTVEGPERFDRIVERHQPIFDALRAAGARIRITVMVGNHDYDLACEPEFRDRLARYNLVLDTDVSVKRELLGRTIWIEHGQQADPFNASPEYGNRYALPVGYFITRTVVAGASRFSSFGRGDWLKDIRSVPTDRIPDWLLSNYFYREMGWIVRSLLTIFLALLTVTLVALVLEILRRTGVIDVNYLVNNPLFRSLGFVGSIFSGIIVVNMLILFFMAVVSIPGAFVLHDILTTLRRFHLTSFGVTSLEGLSGDTYLRRAREVFAGNPEAAVYIFGHTHHAFLSREPDGRVILNTGTWLKILERVPVRFGYLPAVYYPAFRLGYFHIAAEGEAIVIRRVEIAKPPAETLSRLQRLLTIGRKPAPPLPIPERTVIDAGPGGAAG